MPASATAALQRSGVVDPQVAQQLAGLLGVPAPATQLPPMWHTTQLLDRWDRDELGPDGHPLHGVPVPPVGPHRRMFAGGRAVHHQALRLGVPARRTSSVTASAVKRGRSGELVFVTVRHEYEQDGRVAVVDEQDIVYLPVVRGPASPPEGDRDDRHPPLDESLDGEQRFEVDPVTLFLFSSVTANAHRIHYDLEYARSEGHADLVVHGPLQVLLMAGVLAARGVEFSGREFAYRLLSPARGPQVLRVGRPAARDADVVVLDGRGRRVAQAVLTP